LVTVEDVLPVSRGCHLVTHLVVLNTERYDDKNKQSSGGTTSFKAFLARGSLPSIQYVNSNQRKNNEDKKQAMLIRPSDKVDYRI